MSITIICPSCQRSQQAPDRLVGKTARCPACQCKFVIGRSGLVAAERNSGRAASEAAAVIEPRVSAAPQPARESFRNAPNVSAAPKPRRASEMTSRPGGIPAWAWGAVGAGVVLSAAFTLVMIKTLGDVANLAGTSVGKKAVPASAAGPPLVAESGVAAGQSSVVSAAETTGNTGATQPDAASGVLASNAASTERATVDRNRTTPGAGSSRAARASEDKTRLNAGSDQVNRVENQATGSAKLGPLTTAQIVAKCEPSVALVKGKVGFGTGFLAKPGVIATNAHVIGEEFISNVEIHFPSAPEGQQGPIDARLLYFDGKRDLAFLGVKTDMPALELASSYKFMKGEDITMIGNPGLGEELMLENAISRGVMSSKMVIEGMNYLQVGIAINPGNSGGPAFDSAGRVIGVATLKAAKAESLGFCIPIEEVQSALTRMGSQSAGTTEKLVAWHRANVAFKLLTSGGAVYSAGLLVRANVMQAAGSAQANLTPTDEAKKLHEMIVMLDQKLYSLVNDETLREIQSDKTVAEKLRRVFPELAANYKALKQLYNQPTHPASQYASKIQNLKSNHTRLAKILSSGLSDPIPEPILAALQAPVTLGSAPTLLVDMMPPQIQPRLLPNRPMLGPRRLGPGGPNGLGGPIGPNGQGMISPAQSARERMQMNRDRMRNRLRGGN